MGVAEPPIPRGGLVQSRLTYLSIGPLPLFRTHAAAKSGLRGLTSGDGERRPESGSRSHRCGRSCIVSAQLISGQRDLTGLSLSTPRRLSFAGLEPAHAACPGQPRVSGNCTSPGMRQVRSLRRRAGCSPCLASHGPTPAPPAGITLTRDHERQRHERHVTKLTRPCCRDGPPSRHQATWRWSGRPLHR